MAKQRQRGHGEGSIYQRKDGRWAASISLEGGKRKTFYGKTRKEVQEKLMKALHEQQQGILATGPKQTVKDFLNYWLEEVHGASLKLSTYALYRRHLDNHLIPVLGQIQLQKLTADQVQAFCSKKSKEGLSAGTVRLLHTILYAALQDAVRWKRLAINVCDAVTLPRLTRPEIHPLNQEQAQRLLEAAKGNRLECLLTLAIATGMRLGEILALRWSDINLEERTLQVRHTVDYVPGYGKVESEPKTERSRRSITLPQFVVDALKQHRTYQLEIRLKAGATWREQGLVFPNRCGGYFSRMRLYAIFKKLLNEAGLHDMRFHDLRHSAATILLSMGVHPKVVQEILGHSNIGTTMNIYSHVLPSMQRDAMDDMNDLFRREK
jgi:integrase